MPSRRSFAAFSMTLHLCHRSQHPHRALKTRSVKKEITPSAFSYLTLCQTSFLFSPSKDHFFISRRRSPTYWNILPKRWLVNLSVITATLRILFPLCVNSKSHQVFLGLRKDNASCRIFPTSQRLSTSSLGPGPNGVLTSGSSAQGVYTWSQARGEKRSS